MSKKNRLSESAMLDLAYGIDNGQKQILFEHKDKIVKVAIVDALLDGSNPDLKMVYVVFHNDYMMTFEAKNYINDRMEFETYVINKIGTCKFFKKKYYNETV